MVLSLEPQGTDRVKVEDTLKVTRSHQGWCSTVLVSFCFFVNLTKVGLSGKADLQLRKCFYHIDLWARLWAFS